MASGMINTITFFVYLLIGIYFLNAPFGFIPLPEISVWFIFIGGILLIFGGIKHIRTNHFGMRMY